jgi:hypothetical protein
MSGSAVHLSPKTTSADDAGQDGRTSGARVP